MENKSRKSHAIPFKIDFCIQQFPNLLKNNFNIIKVTDL